MANSTASEARLGRRQALALLALLGGKFVLRGAPARGGELMVTRLIPSTGEALPAVGLGTWQTFDVGEGERERAPLREVLRRFFEGGARVIDSSPMYGRSEGVVGDLVRGTAFAKEAFMASKVWTEGRDEGVRQMVESERRMGGRLDLLQVHNLVDVEVQLETLRAWRAARRIRYLGITHYSLAAFPGMERLLREEKVDFVQLPYSVAVREAERRLLPAARDTGTAVIVMRPFEGGTLFRQARSLPLPPFARELGARSWAQLFLKWILGHPAVTVVIPATSDPEHLADDLGAGFGPLPDEPLRRRLLAYLGT